MMPTLLLIVILITTRIHQLGDQGAIEQCRYPVAIEFGMIR
ncbi:hypothetical protein XBJ2_240007 [Xenorhabdus bovienii str. Jollieti]|nr:hypothetical protein XBJ2_240007 [Xenorhabdus bovienii str. Jollieti]